MLGLEHVFDNGDKKRPKPNPMLPTPDPKHQNDKSKCHVLLVGKENTHCPTLMVHGEKMSHVSEDTYRGEIISNDGKKHKEHKQQNWKRNRKDQ